MSIENSQPIKGTTEKPQEIGFASGTVDSPFDPLALLKEGNELKVAGFRDTVCSVLPFSGVCAAGDKLGEVNNNNDANKEQNDEAAKERIKHLLIPPLFDRSQMKLPPRHSFDGVRG